MNDVLKKFWNDETNQHHKSEIVLELSKKLGRQLGGILSRIKKLKLE